MKKNIHFLKKQKFKSLGVMVVIFSLPLLLRAAEVVTVIRFTPVTITKIESNAITASTNITYSNSSKSNTTSVNGPKIDAILYKRTLLGLSSSEVTRVTIQNTPVKYNTPTSIVAKFAGLKDSEEYWVTFNESDFPKTIISSERFTLESKTTTFGGGSFGGGGATGSWTEDTSQQTTNTSSTSTDTAPKPSTAPKPASVPVDAKPIPPTLYDLEFRFLPDVNLQTIKAKGSVKFVSSDGSKGVLTGTVTLTPVAYNGDRLTTETITLPNTNLESGETYPLELPFSQKIPLGVFITEVKLGSLDNVSVFPVTGELNGPSTNTVSDSDGKTTNFSVTKAEYNPTKKTINFIGSINYSTSFSVTDKYNKILFDLYSGGEKISTKNITITKSTTGNSVEFNSIVTDVDPLKKPTTFRIKDNSIGVVSNLFPIKSVDTQATQGDTVTAVSGLVRFSGASTANTTVKVNGDITPIVTGNALSLKGEVTYICGIQKKISQSSAIGLSDKTGVIYQSIPTKINGSNTGVIDCEIPLHFEVNFTDFRKVAGSDGKLIDPTTPKEAPLAIQFIDKSNKLESNKIVVISSIVKNTNSSNTSGSSTIPTQTSSLTVPSGEFKGKKIDISITKSVLVANVNIDSKLAKYPNLLNIPYAEAQANTQASVKVDGFVKYNDFGQNATNVDKLGKLALTLKGKDGALATQDSLDIVSLSGTDLTVPIPFSTSFDNVDPTKGPFTVEVTEKDLGVTSSAFRVITQTAAASDADGDGIPDSDLPGAPSKNRLSLVNPLAAAGLDSIPAVVSVLVRDIVIPIAVPFLGLSIIYTGFLFVQARGNAEKLKKAKEALKWTLIGGALILGAYVIAEALQATISDIIK